MNDLDVERQLREWMREPGTRPAGWILESVTKHAGTHSNERWWRQLQRGAHGGALDRWAAGRGPVRVRFMAMTATVAALLLAVVLVVSSLTPELDPRPAVVPASPAPTAVALPETTPPPEAATGLTGSLWLAQTDGALESDITLHPDGTLVQRVRGSGTPVGLGMWQPTGEHSLSSVVIFLDADPNKHVKYGLGTYRAEWQLDDDAESGIMTWTATLQPGDGSAPTEVSGDSLLTRQHPLPPPQQARYPLPAEPEWTLGIGSTGRTPGSGTVAAVQLVGSCDDLAPDYLVVHDDGTVFIAGDLGNGVGLWVSSGPGTSALTGWSHTGVTNVVPEHWVGELSGRSLLVRHADVLEQLLAAAPSRIEPMGGMALPEVDPALWPELGSVWLQETPDGPAIAAYLADGTAIIRHRRHGTGAGYWQPIDAHTIASSVAFPERELKNVHLRAQATVASDGTTMTMHYQLVERNHGSEETGEMTATRLRLDP